VARMRAGRVGWPSAGALAVSVVLAFAQPASAAGAWRIDAGPVKSNASLSAVSCVSPTACVAVGSIGNYSPTFKTYAESWSGSKWSAAPSSGPTGSELRGVSCVAANWCQAVGDSSNLGTFLTEHWDGHTWSQVASPALSSSYLYGISCTSRAWCVAVGSFAAPHQVATVVERWDGTKWSTVSSPNRGTNNSFLQGVSCVSPSWCAAVGETQNAGVGSQSLVEMWNGKTWRIVPSPNLPNELNYLASVDCVSSTWCIAVGNTETGGLIERWDGHTWTSVVDPSAHHEGAGLSGISCALRTACVAVGSVVESWNGHVWSTVALPGGAYSVSCPTATVCKANGSGTKIYTKN
jgi:hypothetical protein